MADVTTASKQTERSRKTAVRRKCVSSRLRSFMGSSAGEVSDVYFVYVTLCNHCRAPGGIVNSEQTRFDVFQGIFSRMK